MLRNLKSTGEIPVKGVEHDNECNRETLVECHMPGHVLVVNTFVVFGRIQESCAVRGPSDHLSLEGLSHFPRSTDGISVFDSSRKGLGLLPLFVFHR